MNGQAAVCIDSPEVKKLNRKPRYLWLFFAGGMLILILDSKTALRGAADGIELCLKTVVPSLFPFFVLSAALMQSCQGSALGILIPAFLGGYPVGAQTVYQAYLSGAISKRDAEKLLAFCNNAGPAFLFGMVGQLFPGQSWVWALWGTHVLGAVIAAGFVVGFPIFIPVSDRNIPQNPSEITRKSVGIMGVVCGWIVLFRVVIAFLDRWILWLFPTEVRVALIGLLELSNGCWELRTIASVPVRFLLCGGMIAVGGLCVRMQTASVTPGLSLRYYALGKLVQLGTSLIVGSSILLRTPLPLLLILPYFLVFKKRGGNRRLSGI